MPYDQGDIVLVSFPFTDLSSTKIRPAIIVSNSEINQTEDVILAAITTTIYEDEFSFFLDNDDLSKPLKEPSEVRCHKLFTCDQSIIKRVITKLDGSKVGELAKSIRSQFSTV